MTTAYDRVLDRLAEATGYSGRASRGRLSTRCPAHEDRSPSLSVRAADDRVLLHCFGGCTVDEVLAALGLARRDLFDEPRAHQPDTKRPPRADHTDPGWSYVDEPPDDPHGYRVAAYAASTAYVPVGYHAGGPVAAW